MKDFTTDPGTKNTFCQGSISEDWWSGFRIYLLYPLFTLGFLMFITTDLYAQKNTAENKQGVTPTLTPTNGLTGADAVYGFEIDGNAKALNWPAPVNGRGYGDWFSDPPPISEEGLGLFMSDLDYDKFDGTNPVFDDGSSGPDYKEDELSYFLRDDITNNDPSVFDGSNKIDDDPNTYKWKIGSAPNKNEIQTVAVHFTYGATSHPEWPEGTYTDGDDLWIIFAGDREDINGSSYIDFELLQETLSKNSDGTFTSSASPSTGGRTIGDLLVTLEFTIGGAAARVVVREWKAVNGGYEYVLATLDTPKKMNGIFASVNTVETIVPWSVYDKEPISTNPSFYQYDINQWAEGAVNLSAFFPQDDPCFQISTLFIRTRTSGSSGTSELKDFPGDPIQLNLDFTPDAPILTDVSNCGPWDGTLEATGCEGEVKWYDAAEDGNLLHTGAIFDPEGEVTETTSYWASCTVDGCEGPRSMVTVTIIPQPDLDPVDPVTACDSYELPALSIEDGTNLVNPQYYDDSQANGGELIEDLTLTESQTVWVYDETDTDPNCSDEISFMVTINYTPSLDPIDAVTACDSYELPAVGAITGSNLVSPKYFTDNQANGGIEITDLTLTASQTVWVYDETGTDPNCSDEISFIVTINDTPDLDPIEDVLACDSYTLPDPSTLTGTNLVDPQYYDDSQANGGQLITEYTLTESQTVWVYDETDTDPNCFDEIEFDVVITDSPVADDFDDVTKCDEYILPDLSAGNQYFTGTGGTGDELQPGDAITSTQTIYIYADASEPCVADETSFLVTIYDSPTADDFSDVTRCDSYTLPALSAGSQYFTGADATGTELFEGDEITSTQVIYIYAEATDPCVADETSFLVTINDTPVLDAIGDVTECDEYTLPDPSLITGSNLVDPKYYDDSQANGGQVITNLTLTVSQMVWVYDETGTDPNCFDEISFMVTIEECAQEGCTLGYWKNHTDRWECYSTCTLYTDVFGTEENPVPDELQGLTLLEVLNLGGGGIYNLGRQSVAALLNACHTGIDYGISDVISYVNENFDNAGAAGSYLDMLNQAGCPLFGSSATTEPTPGCPAPSSQSLSADSAAAAGFTVSPNPFRDVLNIQYNFDYTSDVVIEIFDLGGNKLKKVNISGASAGQITTISADFVRGQQMYIVKVKTNKESFTQNVVSGN